MILNALIRFSLMASTADSLHSETLKSLGLKQQQSLFSLMNNVSCNFLSKVVEVLQLTLSYTAIVFLISFVILVPFHGDHLRVSWSFDLVIITLVYKEKIIQRKRIVLRA